MDPSPGDSGNTATLYARVGNEHKTPSMVRCDPGTESIGKVEEGQAPRYPKQFTPVVGFDDSPLDVNVG